MRHPVAVSGRLGPLLLGWAVGTAGLASIAEAQGTAKPADRPAAPARPSATTLGAPRPATDGLNFANGLYRNRRYDLAADEYEQFIRGAQAGTIEAGAGEVADAWFGLGNARVFLHKYKEARQAFEGFVRVAPDHPNAPLARYRIGEAAYMLGDLAEAKRSLETYTTDGGDRRFLPAAWTFLGDIATRSSDLAAARTAYENALAGDAKGTLGSRARLGLGRILAAQGESAPALAVLRELIATGGPEWLDKAWLQIGQVEATANHWPRRSTPSNRSNGRTPRAPSSPKAGSTAPRRWPGSAAAARPRRCSARSPPTRKAPLRSPPATPWGPSSWPPTSRPRPSPCSTPRWAAPTPPARRPRRSGPRRAGRSGGGKAGDARDPVRRHRHRRPQDTWADDAQLRAAALALDARDYADARRLAGSFGATYPGSPLQADAHLIDARAALGLNQPRTRSPP